MSTLKWFMPAMGQVFKLCRRLKTTHSLESGVLQHGDMENMQGGVLRGPRLRNTVVPSYKNKTSPASLQANVQTIRMVLVNFPGAIIEDLEKRKNTAPIV